MPEPSTPVRVAGFLGALGLVFAATFAVGTWVGPLEEPAEPAEHNPAVTQSGGTGEH